MISYRVEQPPGTVVWSDTTADYEGYEHFPAIYRDNTQVADVVTHIFVNDELISTVTPHVLGE